METRVVIIGGGFGGLKAAKLFGNSPEIKVTLLDRKNHHLFQPLLYQVATASISPTDIGVPIRMILSPYKNISVHMENVVSIDLKEKRVITDSDQHEFDYLIMACGSTHSYFGKDEWENLAPGLKTIEQALEIRRRILTAFELAEKEKDTKLQANLLTFAIIGGGPTGVELAGALAELAKSILSKEFRKIHPEMLRVILIDGGDRLLMSFHPLLSEKAKLALQNRGVEIIQDQHVENITNEGIVVAGKFIEAKTILWAAGVKAAAINQTLGLPMDKQGRVIVTADLSLPGYKNIFMIGDQAHFESATGPLPGIAPVAVQQASHAVKNIFSDLKKKPRTHFTYINKGTMAVIGRSTAIVEAPFGKLSGFLAWIIWAFVHIMALVGYRNRLIVLVNWAWSYFTFKGGARLITSATWKETKSNILP